MRALLLALMLSASPLVAQEARQITGTAVLAEEPAPEGAILVVELRGPFGVVLGTDRRDGSARTDFAVSASTIPATLATALMSEADPTRYWASTPVPVPPGGDVQLGELPLIVQEAASVILRLDCAGSEVRVGLRHDMGPQELFVQTPEGNLALQLGDAPTGTRYVLPEDPDTWFWNQGDVVQLSRAGVVTDCGPRPAETYSAAGEDWALTLTAQGGGFARFAGYRLEQGEDIAEGRTRGANWTGRTIRFASLEDGPEVVVTPLGCPDNPDFSDKVEVIMWETTLDGCGGGPAPEPVAAPTPEPEPNAAETDLGSAIWVIEDIGGGGIIDSSRLSIFFGEDGRAAGEAGCNRWHASFRRDGEGISFHTPAATRRACAEALMQQERRFLDALAQVVEFRIDRTGALLLLDAQGTAVLTARR